MTSTETITATVEGTTVTIGDFVGFKCDVEQRAQIVAIQRARCLSGPYTELVLKAPPEGFAGNYIGRADLYAIAADDCWI